MKGEKRKVWIFVVDSRNSGDLRDLDHLDAVLWGSNPNAKEGDIILIYRTAPYSDIAYVFSATSDPRPTQPDDHADMDYVIELGNKVRLSNPLTLIEIRHTPQLSEWSFARHQQGVMRRKKDIKQEGFWKDLRTILIANNPSLVGLLTSLEDMRKSPRSSKDRLSRRSITSTQGRFPLRVFISYTSLDLRRVRSLYRKLSKERGLDLWFDKVSLTATDEWHPEIIRAIHSSDTIVICLSSRSVEREGFAKKEIEWALTLCDEQPEGTVSIVPVKLDRCEVPRRLARWQYAELFRKDGYRLLIAGLRKRATVLRESHLR